MTRANYFSLVVLASCIVWLGSCAPASPTLDLLPTPIVTLPIEGPTPLPIRDPHPPGELFDYQTQSGDTLPALAAHFHTSIEEILEANPSMPEVVTTLPPDYPLRIPSYYAPLTGSPFHILPDSEVINGPSSVEFDYRNELLKRPGFLSDLSTYAYQRQRDAWEVVEVVALNYSVNPRVLLALLEHQTQSLTNPFPEGDETRFPLGFKENRYRGLFWQLVWAAERLNDGYYGWRIGSLDEFVLADGLILRPDPWQNAGTVAVHYVFAGLYGMPEFERAVGPEGFYETYRQLWGDPFDLAIELIPGGLLQPELELPFLPDHIWDFTGGPHYSWGSSLPFGALDFAPPASETGCHPSGEWITAPADGFIVRSDESVIVLDLDGDGEEGTGWVLFFYHVASEGMVQAGIQVAQGDLLGHPSCEGGRATGTHVHLARRYNGEWIPAAGPLAFTLAGWVADYEGKVYEGTLTKGSKVVPACVCASAENRIFYELP